jgi:4'-phosphopantetheinyl transferase
MKPALKLGDNEAAVWQFDCAQIAIAGERLSRLLAPHERERAARFRLAADARRFALARSLLRIVLGRYLAIAPERVTLAYTEAGKPKLSPASTLEFNLSHSGDRILIGVCRDHPIGVDIERIDPNRPVLELAERAFSAADYAALRATPEPRRCEAFYRMWVRHEARLKAHGTGFSVAPNQEGVAASPHAITIADIDTAPGYCAAVAVLSAAATVRLMDEAIVELPA